MNSKNSTKKIKQSVTSTKIACILSLFALNMSGCSTMNGWLGKHDNGSLDYQKSDLLNPIELPVNQDAQTFVQLYPTIDLGDGNLDMKNDTGKQYKMPAPHNY